MATAGVWIVKANEKPRQTKKRGFHWRKFFGSREEWSWGGREWINSPISMKYLRDEVRKGDTVLAWQVGEGIVGLCKTASGGYEEKRVLVSMTWLISRHPRVWNGRRLPYRSER